MPLGGDLAQPFHPALRTSPWLGASEEERAPADGQPVLVGVHVDAHLRQFGFHGGEAIGSPAVSGFPVELVAELAPGVSEVVLTPC